MTEAIPIDVSGKVISNTKPAAPAALGAGKPPDKPKGPDSNKPGDGPPPAPGSKTFLGWIASGFSRKQLGILLAAVCSLAAGILAVRLIWPEEEPPSATTALVTEAQPATPVVPPRTGPTITLEPPKPAEFIPPASLPMPSAAVAPSAGNIAPPSGLDTLPAIPVAGSSPSAATASAGPLAPLSPTSPGSTPRSTLPAIPAPESLVPAVVPASGTDKPVSPSSGSLPMIPSTPSGTLPASPSSPLLPSLPGTPSIGPSGASEPKPPAPITGLPPKPPESLAPSVEASPKLPAQPAEFSPKLPAGPGSEGARPGGEKLEFVKPAESGSATPAAATRPPTTSYDVDIYHPKANDSWESISREYFSDTRYAGALRAYNQNRALTPGREVDVPPLHVLKRWTPQPAPVAGSPPGRVTPAAGTDPWNAAGSAAGGAKTYRIPQGDGMSLPAVAKLVLGNDQRWRELYDLNPEVNPSKVTAGTELKLPADSRVQ
jgi:hypothetical protein